MLALITLLSTSFAALPQDPPSEVVRLQQAPAFERLAHQLGVVANAGQWPREVAFQTRTGGSAAFCTEHGLVVVGQWRGPEVAGPQRGKGPSDGPALGGWALALNFEGAAAAPRGEERQAATVGFCRGTEADWVLGVPTYDRARYDSVWPGIDVVVQPRAGFVAYDLELSAAAQVAAISIRCEGALGLEVDEHGRLVARTGLGELVQSAPVAFHVLPDGRHEPVGCRFELRADGHFGFQLTGPRRALPLVIDPTLRWSSFLGGIANDRPFGAGCDPVTGESIAAGLTWSIDFPRTLGPVHGGARDAFVTKWTSGDTPALSWSMFLGGGGDEWASDLAVDATGRIAVTGCTINGGFPTTSNAPHVTAPGGADAFATLLSPAGVVLSSTYLGTSGLEFGSAVTFAPNGEVVIGGVTEQPPTGATPLVTAGALHTAYLGGATDHFVLRWAPMLVGSAQLRWGTYFGGNGMDGFYYGSWDPPNMLIMDVLVDGNDDIHICGRSESTNLQTTPNAVFPTFAGGTYADAFYGRIDGTGSTLQYLTYAGSVGDDAATGLALHPGGGVALAGLAWDAFPQTAGAWGTGYQGNNDVIMFWIDTTQAGSAGLRYSAQIGSGGYDWANEMALDSAGIWTMVGGGAPGFPTTSGCFQSASAGLSGTVLRVHVPVTGSATAHYSSFLGNGASWGSAVNRVALEANGRLLLACETDDTSFSTTPGSSQPGYGGGYVDGAVLLFDALPAGAERTTGGTPACSTRIVTGVNSWPQSGNLQFTAHAVGAPPAAPGLALVGFPALPTTLLNAELLIAPAGSWTVFTPTNAWGLASLGFPIPAAAPPGTALSLQFWFVTSAQCPGSGPVASSDRLELLVQ